MIDILMNYPWHWIDRMTPGKHLENTPMSSSWRVLSPLLRSRSTGFLCEWHSGSPLRRRCFTSYESPTAENWWTTAAALMRLLCVNGDTVSPQCCRKAAVAYKLTTVATTVLTCCSDMKLQLSHHAEESCSTDKQGWITNQNNKGNCGAIGLGH